MSILKYEYMYYVRNKIFCSEISISKKFRTFLNFKIKNLRKIAFLYVLFFYELPYFLQLSPPLNRAHGGSIRYGMLIY